MPKRPSGGMTSSVSPTLSAALAQAENRPSATRLTAMRTSPSSRPGADGVGPPHLLAADRGAERQVLAGREGEAVLRSAGMAKAIDTASAVSRRTSLMRRGKNIGGISVAFEPVERLAAGGAAPERFAGGGAELGETLDRVAAAARTGDLATPRRRCRRAMAGRCRIREACGGRPR